MGQEDCVLFYFSLARPAKEVLTVFRNCVLVYLKKSYPWGSAPVRSPTRSLVCLFVERVGLFTKGLKVNGQIRHCPLKAGMDLLSSCEVRLHLVLKLVFIRGVCISENPSLE